MGRVGWVDFAEVKQRVTMGMALNHYEWQWDRRRGDGVEGRCPIHGGQRRDAFHAELKKGVFHCFACQAHGSVLDLVAALERCSLREAGERIKCWWGAAGQSVGVVRTAEEKLVREKEKVRALGFSLHPIDIGCGYLKERGIEMETARCFGAGWYGGPGLMHGRVVVPIHDEEGRLVAYAGRAMDGSGPKYRLPSGFRKSELLFNLYRTRASGQKRVVVVEGFFDCMKVHQAGESSVVALMGCSLSARQQRLLLNSFDAVILMLDGDEAGRRATQCIGEHLTNLIPTDVVWLPNGQPDEMSAADIRRVLASAGGQHLPVPGQKCKRCPDNKL